MNSKNVIKVLDTYGVLCVGTTEFLFDLEDMPIIQSRNWYEDKDGYLVSYYFYAGKRRCVRFHRVVMNAERNQYVDHINKKKSDNRKQNLRLCSREENDRNRGLYSSNKSGIAGVHFDKRRRQWVATITCNNKRIFIGRFYSKEDAVIARLEREIELFKEFAPQKALWEKLNQKQIEV